MRKLIRILSILLALLVLESGVVLAATGMFDFSKYNNDELLMLETALQEEKISRGLAKSAIVTPGKYIIGVDIPAGIYRIETVKGVADHLNVDSAKGKRVASYSIGTAADREAIGKVELLDGYTVYWNSCTVKFIVYTGGIVFE